MKLIQIYHNEEMLPTESSPQRAFFVTLPQIFKWGLSAPITIGYAYLNDSRYGTKELKVIVLGFGFIYNINWDN